ncbi:hypothetical protein LZ31DRAFT_55631 [Colletotrichum somersetense]|nr:hypothetical protein LZ31DRAFT_55631 [Colletotrichum somersetense]
MNFTRHKSQRGVLAGGDNNDSSILVTAYNSENHHLLCLNPSRFLIRLTKQRVCFYMLMLLCWLSPGYLVSLWRLHSHVVFEETFTDNS